MLPSQARRTRCAQQSCFTIASEAKVMSDCFRLRRVPARPRWPCCATRTGEMDQAAPGHLVTGIHAGCPRPCCHHQKSDHRWKPKRWALMMRALDHVPKEPNTVLVPAWRHALISLRDPLLEQGLRILDTPGLNSLGSEPELTFPCCRRPIAVIFLLSADTGVTASDRAIWNEHICDRRRGSLRRTLCRAEQD